MDLRHVIIEKYKCNMNAIFNKENLKIIIPTTTLEKGFKSIPNKTAHPKPNEPPNSCTKLIFSVINFTLSAAEKEKSRPLTGDSYEYLSLCKLGVGSGP